MKHEMATLKYNQFKSINLLKNMLVLHICVGSVNQSYRTNYLSND